MAHCYAIGSQWELWKVARGTPTEIKSSHIKAKQQLGKVASERQDEGTNSCIRKANKAYCDHEQVVG